MTADGPDRGDSPAASALHERVDRLSRAQRSTLFARLTAGRANAPDGVGPATLTPVQEASFPLAAAVASTPVFNMPAAWRLHGALDVTALGAALDFLVDRHEALRTAIVAGPDGRAAPRVVASVEAVLHFAGRVDGAPQAVAAVLERARTPLDIGRPPHLRGVLYEIGPADHVLALVTHHLAVDGGSIEILLRELGVVYAALLRGDTPALESVPSPSRLATAIRQRLDRGGRDAALAYWETALAPPLSALPFATSDALRAPQVGTAHESVVSPVGAAKAAKALAHRERATIFMVTLAALAAVLGERTQRPDVRIATDLSNRHHSEGRAAVGDFTNFAVLRLRPEPALSLRELVVDARRVMLAAADHGELPFSEVAEHLSASGVDPLGLCDTSLESRASDVIRLELEGMTTTSFAESWLRSGPTNFSAASLGFHLRMTDKGIGGHVRYHPAAVDAGDVRTLMMRLWRVFSRAEAAPNAPLRELTQA